MDYDVMKLGVPAAGHGLCSIEGEGDGGGGGAGGGGEGAAGLIDGGGEGGAGGQGGDGGGDGGGEANAWLEQFSAEGGEGDKPSNRDWLTSKGFKSVDDVVKSYRETEHALRAGGKLAVPGEDARPEEIEAFHKAIGRPDNAEGYAFDLPEGGEMDMDLVGPLRDVAFKAGVPAAGFKELAEGMVKVQLDQMQAMKTAEDESAASWRQAQGAQADAKMADVNRGLKALGLGAADVQAFQRGYYLSTGEAGSSKVLDLFAKIGAGVGEDALDGGGRTRQFGVTGAQAQAEIDQLIVDEDFQKKLSAKDPAAVARWDRLNDAVAADRDAKARANG